MIDDANEWIRLRLSDEPEDVWRAVNERLPLPVWMQIHEQAPQLRPFIAANRTSPCEMLELLARDANALVRLTVAQRDDAPESVLRALADDVSEAVRVSVAGNPSTRRDVLNYLLRVDDAEAVRKRASARLYPHASPSSHS